MHRTPHTHPLSLTTVKIHDWNWLLCYEVDVFFWAHSRCTIFPHMKSNLYFFMLQFHLSKRVLLCPNIKNDTLNAVQTNLCHFLLILLFPSFITGSGRGKKNIFCVTPSSKSKTFFAHIISLCEREHRHLHCWKETLPMAFFKIEQNWMFAQKRNSLVMNNFINVALFLRTLKLETWNFCILIFTGDACTLFLCDSAM